MKPNASALTRNLAFIAGAALLALAIAAPSGAALGPWERLTFRGPVALPGAVLPTGAYVFEVANPGSSHPVVRVSHRDTRRVYFSGFTEIVPRPADLPDDQMVTFGEAPAGKPVPIAAWYPTGRSQGHRFIYR
jgi:hypothetical protein